MPNHLIHANSPYLLQHANNPVDWYPWGESALARARRENKPIFLSIGYAACHWCHVMAHESFEDLETAALMNQSFVCIKVDREERPDLDSIYMTATQALTGAGGWPMSVFLTPDLRPFYAGTYFPPIRRYNMPSFKELLSTLAEAWEKQPDEIERVSKQVLEHLQAAGKVNASEGALDAADLETITNSVLEAYDWGYGGWGGAPKFPQPMLVDFLLRRSIKRAPLQDQCLKAVQHALRAMSRGGMYDVVGGGFARYSTDNFWRVPHFEKMLYDNAQLALAYLHGWQRTREPAFKDMVVQTLDFVRRELTDSEGGFYSSLDADSEGEEGKFYAWTQDELRAALPDDLDFELVSTAYAVTEKGNWEGKMVLQRALDDATLAARMGLTPQELNTSLERAHAALLLDRGRRVRPATDDKVLAGWNGLMLQGFAEAARYLGDDPRAPNYLAVAQLNGEFILDNMRVGGQLRRTWRRGQVGGPAFLEDYGSLICGMLSLYQVDFNNRWFAAARELADEMIERFADPQGGFFDTADDGEQLLLRPRDMQDSATPSGGALAADALLQLEGLTGRGAYRQRAEAALRLAVGGIRQFPTAFARWLSVADSLLSDRMEIAILYGRDQAELAQMLATINAEYRPDIALAAASYPPQAGAPELLRDRSLKEGKATAYVCKGFVCELPVNTADALAAQLDS